MGFLMRWLVNTAGFYAAILIVPGIYTTATGLRQSMIVALIAGLVNTAISPIFKFFTFPFVFLTLGLWLWIANMLMFWFAGYVGRDMGFGFTLSGFWATFFGALVVSVVSSILSWVMADVTKK